MCRKEETPLNALAPGLSGEEVRRTNGITLAFLGDAVYELMVRSFVLATYNGRAQSLHERTIAFSNAAFQAQAGKRLLPHLTEEETAVFRRGRNAHTSHTPKNKTGADYHMATALEALFGHLYITGQTERIGVLFSIITEKEEQNENA